MTYFWRLIFSVIIAFTLAFLTPSANSLLLANTQIPARDFLKLGVNQMQQGNYQSAIENLTLAIQMQSNLSAAYSDRCLAYLQLQDYHAAIADCTQALNLAPDNSQAYLNRGLAHYRQGNYPNAIADYNQVIALTPANFRAHYNRGIAFAEEGNYSQAIIDYNLALTQISPTNTLLLADIYNDRGLANLELQNLAAAMKDFNLAIHFNAEDDRAYFNRACACERSGDILGAMHDFSQVIRLKPSNALAYVNRGVANYNLGYYQRAIADLQKASAYFEQQKETLASKKTLYLLKTVQQEISSVMEIA
ncbi:tetratricopeptide repeat protein [Anabaena lutea]|uniref:Tetratricopeptide repeat protein n=1 Tax=Anabaena lutea FACHB-196 TaxID=2692881 RepID=A0ABR8FQH3_9NOST|nr:tetratricopeptide repeat protein [Anabaena lutea]MBD2570971.1 tetratricopeptide repeat protein [Anabaena lutea FACHB-196]